MQCSSFVKRVKHNWGWVVVACTWLLYVVMFGIMYSYGLFFIAFQEEFDSSATITGWAGAIPVALTVILAPPANMAVERFGYRPVVLSSLIAATLGVLTTSFMPVFLPVYATYSVMFGLGSGMLGITSMKLIIAYFPSQNAVRASGLALSGSSTGSLSFAPFLTFLLETYGWRTALRILAAILGIVGTPCVLSLVEPSYDKSNHSRDNLGRVGEDQPLGSPESGVEGSHYGDTAIEKPNAKTCQGASKCDHSQNVISETNSSGKIVVGAKEGGTKDKSGEDKPLENVVRDETLSKRLFATFMYLELYLLILAVLIQGVGDCFYYVNMVSYMVSTGFTKDDGSLVLMVMGVSNLIGKLLVSLLGELLPVPNIAFSFTASIVGVAVMSSLLVADSIGKILGIAAVIGGVMMPITTTMLYTLPNDFFGPERAKLTWPVIVFSNGIGYLLGSLVGQSIDRTGSYRAAIFAFMGLYVTSASLFAFAPVYQKFFAKDRYVVMEIRRKRRLDRRLKDQGAMKTSGKEPLEIRTSHQKDFVYEIITSV
ncbi:monocarboxylate transporter 12-like [Diadema antillarum]|uniref:monocarboxylate transporter 12-like n=1 Tax=Diadema antillarum TaxID=105358 RepID=UPI003A8392D0